MSDELPGSLRGGRYTIVRKLGEGSQGETFEAVDTTTGARVALKRFRVRGAKSWKDVELAEREARVLASLDHPSVPRYIDHFEEAGTLCLVTQYIEGESLVAMRKRGVRFTETEIVRLLKDTGTALDYLHGLSPPVIHRDIKPSNVLRRADGSYALIDFGAVRDKMKPEGGSTVVGTFGFMAPEQFQGRAMAASDVYGAGATALCLLTGREPEDLPHKGLAIDVRSAVGSGTSPALVDALVSMLEPDPDRRAARIGPLLARIDAGGDSRDAGRAKVNRPQPAASTATSVPDDVQFMSRHERRAAEQVERISKRIRDRVEQATQREVAGEERRRRRHQRKRDRFDARMRGFEGLPRLIVTLGLAVAVVAITVAVRVVTPIVLTLLGIFFGAKLRDAATKVSDAGRKAVEAVLRVQRAMGEDLQDPEVAPVRVEAEAATGVQAPGVRVASEHAAGESAEREEPGEHPATAERRRPLP